MVVILWETPTGSFVFVETCVISCQLLKPERFAKMQSDWALHLTHLPVPKRVLKVTTGTPHLSEWCLYLPVLSTAPALVNACWRGPVTFGWNQKPSKQNIRQGTGHMAQTVAFLVMSVCVYRCGWVDGWIYTERERENVYLSLWLIELQLSVRSRKSEAGVQGLGPSSFTTGMRSVCAVMRASTFGSTQDHSWAVAGK